MTNTATAIAMLTERYWARLSGPRAKNPRWRERVPDLMREFGFQSVRALSKVVEPLLVDVPCAFCKQPVECVAVSRSRYPSYVYHDECNRRAWAEQQRDEAFAMLDIEPQERQAVEYLLEQIKAHGLTRVWGGLRWLFGEVPMPDESSSRNGDVEPVA